jgi:hypothetical protein
MKQIGLALHNYHETVGTFPIGAQVPGRRPNWRVAILPYLEQSGIYNILRACHPSFGCSGMRRLGATGCRFSESDY